MERGERSRGRPGVPAGGSRRVVGGNGNGDKSGVPFFIELWISSTQRKVAPANSTGADRAFGGTDTATRNEGFGEVDRAVSEVDTMVGQVETAVSET